MENIGIPIQEAMHYMGKIVICSRRDGRVFAAKLVGTEQCDEVLIFETKAGKIKRDVRASILLIQEAF